MTKRLSHTDLVSMAPLASIYGFTIDLVYAKPTHPDNMFKEAIYRADAQLWLHKDLAEIVCLGATLCRDRYNLFYELKDGLRTATAQKKMEQTTIVQQNMHWLTGTPRLLSNPGAGAHPRGMAIDIILKDASEKECDMGTDFDALPPKGQKNPASRECCHFDNRAVSDAEILKNRHYLTETMCDAAQQLNRPLRPLPAEWWDFRFPDVLYQSFAPLADEDLPSPYRMVL